MKKRGRYIEVLTASVYPSFFFYCRGRPMCRPFLIAKVVCVLSLLPSCRYSLLHSLFTSLIPGALMPLWHILCPERQRMQSALFYRHGSSFSEYTYSPPTSTSLGSAQQSSFTRQSDVRNILLFRQVIPALRPLIPQRGRLCSMYCLT